MASTTADLIKAAKVAAANQAQAQAAARNTAAQLAATTGRGPSLGENAAAVQPGQPGNRS